MKTHILPGLALAALSLSALCPSVQAQRDPHPTLTAVHRYGHRKTAHAANAIHHTGAHMHNWKHRKAHNVRAWLNKH